MFEFIYGLGKNKELETIVQEIDSNIANNYKDAAQEVFVLLEQKFQELLAFLKMISGPDIFFGVA